MFKALKRIFRNLRGRSFEGAGGSGRWPIAASMPSLAQSALAQRATLAHRASFLAANAPIVESISNTLCTNLIGDGPSARSSHQNSDIRVALEQSWGRFYSAADIEDGDLVSILNRVVRGLITHGEAFIRLITIETGELKLQLLSPDQIDSDFYKDDNIVSGIELGPLGQRLAYWVKPHGDKLYSAPIRLPADDILHVYEPRFPGQIRGITWLYPVLTRIVELDALEDAALAKAKTTALLAGFLRDLEGNAFGDTTKFDPNSLSLEPGTLRLLPPGADISFSPTSDMSGLSDFIKHTVRSISSGSGTPYTLIADDLSDVNYSSARLGFENFRRRCAAIRASILGSRFLQPLWARHVALEILTERLNTDDFNAPRSFDVDFLWPEPAALNPLDEAKADVEALNAGLRSRSEIIAARGRDPSEVFDEIANDPPNPIGAPDADAP